MGTAELGLENRLLQKFNNLWLYLCLVVGFAGVLVEPFQEIEADLLMKVACFLLIVAPVLRNFIRVYLKLQTRTYKDVFMLSIPIVMFIILVIRLKLATLGG